MERNTRQRDAISAAFTTADRPLSAQEVLTLAQAQVPNLGIATVYRAIKAMVDEKALIEVALPGALTRYELPHRGHHHHFHCRHCDRVFEVDGCIGDLRPLTPRGFTTEGHELTLIGLCVACAQTGKAPD